MTRKAPTGARHGSCLDHVPHAYASTGWLCITTAVDDVTWPHAAEHVPPAGHEGPSLPASRPDWRPVDRAADMVRFADHLAAVAAEHRAAEVARRDIPADPDSVRPRLTNAKTGAVTLGDPPIAHAAGTLAHLGAGSPAPEPEPAPVRKARTRRETVAPAILAAEPVTAEPEPVDTIAEPEPVETDAQYRARHDATTAAAGRETVGYVDRLGYLHCLACAVDPIANGAEPVYRDARPHCAEPCDSCGRTLDGSPAPAEPETDMTDDHGAILATVTAPEPEPVTVATCADCGHVDHGGRPCDTCDDRAQVGTYAPCATVTAEPEPEPEPVAMIAEPVDTAPAPILAAVTAPEPGAGRPTCPRCGQTFRKSGAGLSWHLANRPDCAGARPAALSIAN